ncbi:Phosphoesterase PA-phosphatase related protein [Croceitalea dokdonensis DOKDO 023]|uniref:Phosphoesterase PA-phosphatase related protein n=1 Tax=Croceitalea dokdonensis DOKDO 023 TaxID=1300341 RepID=A0A0P7AFL9_9FLAO|nr:phosphatase PAP2 family protein [Croceitalea dokdonensis]KPM32114.1 Phosphoesterase PA-phosphatase related protein [Croceitalea dokdonensis DOKDO 023]
MKNPKVAFLLLLVFITMHVTGQKASSIYEWNWRKDGIWLGTGMGASIAGLLVGTQKTPYTETELNHLERKDVLVLDRWAAGYYSESASVASDYPFYASFGVPFFLLLDNKVSKESGTVIGLYLESLSTTSALFTLTAGLVDRPRPLVFSEDAPLDRRLRKTSKRSFYSGHVAASATALFFAAKIYNDFYPNSPLRHYFWVAAFSVPATIGYLRVKAGKHYLSDIVLGYALGALTGYLVPELHKKTDNRFKLNGSTEMTANGQLFTGLVLRYSF